MSDTIPDLFTVAEIEPACGLPVRSVELLIRHELAPARADPGGRGAKAVYDMTAFSQFSLVGVLFPATGSVMVAARLAKMIRAQNPDPFYTGDAWGKGSIQRDLPAYAVDACRSDLELLQAARYAQTEGMLNAKKGDYRLTLVDGEFVFDGPSAVPFVDSSELVTPLFSYQSDGRGSLRFGDLIESASPEANTALNRWRNAKLRIEINLGLTIRKAMIAVLDHRASS